MKTFDVTVTIEALGYKKEFKNIEEEREGLAKTTAIAKALGDGLSLRGELVSYDVKEQLPKGATMRTREEKLNHNVSEARLCLRCARESELNFNRDEYLLHIKKVWGKEVHDALLLELNKNMFENLFTKKDN